jgi:hypothetical protein
MGDEHVAHHHIRHHPAGASILPLPEGEPRVGRKAIGQQLPFTDHADQAIVPGHHGQAGEAPVIEHSRRRLHRQLRGNDNGRTGHDLANAHGLLLKNNSPPTLGTPRPAVRRRGTPCPRTKWPVTQDRGPWRGRHGRGAAGSGLRRSFGPGGGCPRTVGAWRERRPLTADQSARDRIRSCVFGWASMGWAGSAGTSCAASSTATSQHSRSWQSTTWRPLRPSRTCCITTRPTGRGIAASGSQATSSPWTTIRCGRWSSRIQPSSPGARSVSTWWSTPPGSSAPANGPPRTAGARKVVLTAPGTDVDATIVLGVNQDVYDATTHDIISNASSTTNCAAPMAQVLHHAFGIEEGLLTGRDRGAGPGRGRLAGRPDRATVRAGDRRPDQPCIRHRGRWPLKGILRCTTDRSCRTT